MADVGISIKGLQKMLEITGRIEDLEDELRKPTDKVLSLLLTRVRTYPPPPPGSKYIRTFRFKNSWRKKVILGGGILGLVESLEPRYNVLVMSAKEQAMIHTGRWETDEEIARGFDNEAEAVLNEHISKEVLTK